MCEKRFPINSAYGGQNQKNISPTRPHENIVRGLPMLGRVFTQLHPIADLAYICTVAVAGKVAA